MLTVREAKEEDIKDIAKVHVDSWRTTYRGIVPADYLNSLNYKECEDKWKSRSLKGVFVVQDEIDPLFGFASFGTLRSEQRGYDGELYAIYLLEKRQRKGAGKALLAKGAEFLLHQGFSSMFVWVIKENPSIRFYQAYSPERVSEDIFEIAGERLEVAGFGWPDLSALKTVLNR